MVFTVVLLKIFRVLMFVETWTQRCWTRNLNLKPAAYFTVGAWTVEP